MDEMQYNRAMGEAEMMDATPTPNPDALPKTNEMIVDDEIKSMILRRKQVSETWKEAKRQKWDKCWNHYNQVYDNTNKAKWQSTMFVPASPKVAEVIASNMHSATMAPEKPVEYQARITEAENDVRDANDLLSVDLDQSNFKVHWSDFEKTLCILGTAIGKVEYEKKMAKIKVKERVRPMVPGFDRLRQMLGFPPAPTEQIVEKDFLIKDHAKIRNVDPYDFFPQPGITDISPETWCIERGKICNYELIRLSQDPEEGLVNITPDLLANNPRNLDADGNKQEKESANDEPVRPTAYLDPDQEHELLEYWGPAPRYMVEPDLYGDESRKYEMVYALFWLIDGMYVVRRQVNPWRDQEPPYVHGQYIRVPGQFWGVGPLELILGLQVELNELRNTRQDNVNLILNKIIAVMKDSVAEGDWGRLVSGPGAIWAFSLAGGTDDIRKLLMPVDMPDVTADSWRASQEVYNEIQEVTAAVKAVVGTDGGGGQSEAGTFRGQMLNRQVASERFIMYARILEKTGLSKAIRKMYQRIYQYKSWEACEKALGPERAKNFRFIPPEELDVVAKLVPLGVTTMENKGVKLAQLRDDFTLFKGAPWFKEVDMARHMITVGGDGDPDRFIMSEDELAMYNEQRRQMIANTDMGGMDSMGGGASGEMPGPSAPVAGDVPGPTDGLPRPSLPSRGPGASPMDVMGRPAA